MGTRSLTAVFFKGQYKIAQYGQWDGYPEGQGLTALEFLREAGNIDKLKENLKITRYLDTEGKDREFIDDYNKNAPSYSNEPDMRTPEQKRWWSTYQTRDLGAQILSNVANSTDSEIVLQDRTRFAGDSLFCEYAYVIDLDTNTFEIFEGFNKTPLKKSDRFYSIKKDNPQYEPVILSKAFSLDDLPTNDAFLACFTEDED